MFEGKICLKEKSFTYYVHLNGESYPFEFQFILVAFQM